MSKRPLPIDVQPEDIKSEAVRQAFAAWGRSEMTPSQQRGVLIWMMQELCGIAAIDPMDMPERVAGYTAGQRSIGIVLSNLTGVRLRAPMPMEDDNGRRDGSGRQTD